MLTSLKTRFALITILLLCSFGVTFIAAHETFEAIQTVHHNQTLAQRGDVQLIQPWMTIPYVAHIYHVPENILYAPLHIKKTPTTRHTTIQAIASSQKESETTIIHQIQATVINYRKIHPPKSHLTPTEAVRIEYRGENVSV